MRDKKKTLIGILSILLCIMAVGYALLAQELTITGTSSIDSTWNVEITNITRKEINGGVTENSKSYTASTANFDIGFTQPGDYVIYEIEVTNNGTLDGVVSNINIETDNNPAIIYTTSGLKTGDILAKNGSKNYLTVKIEYDSNVISQPAVNDNDFTVQMNFQQNLGQISTEHDVYAYHTGILSTTASYTDLQTMMANENRELYQDNTELIKVHPFYLKYTVDGDTITKRYACFVKDGTEYCLLSNKYGGIYSNTQNTLLEVFGETNCPTHTSYILYCDDDVIYTSAESSGHVGASDGTNTCDILSSGASMCG